MPTAAFQRATTDAWKADASADVSGFDADKILWARVEAYDATADTQTDGIHVGVRKVAHIHLGTVDTNVATTAVVFEVQAGNPDGTWNDTGNTITIATGATPAVDVVTIFDPPVLLRLKQTSAAATAGVFDMILEAHA